MEPFLGQIQAFGFNFAPRGWAFCNGQIMSINENQSLFSLLGTAFGGDGRTTFGLPDLRGRSIVHVGAGSGLSAITMGEKSGSESVTLSSANLPSHNHGMTLGASPEETGAGNYLAAGQALFAEDASASALNAGAVTNTGGGQAFNNRNPFLGINVCIALVGIYPSRN